MPRRLLWHPEPVTWLTGPTSGVELRQCVCSPHFIWLDWRKLQCQIDVLYIYFCIQAAEATGWITHHTAIDGCRPVACNYGANKMLQRVSICIPIAPYLDRMNNTGSPPPRCAFRALKMLVLWLHALRHSRYLPGIRTAAHDKALNCPQSNQQMTPGGSSSSHRGCRAALAPRSSRKRPTNSNLTSSAHPHHLLLRMWVTRAARMSPDARRHQGKAVSHTAPPPPPRTAARQSSRFGVFRRYRRSSHPSAVTPKKSHVEISWWLKFRSSFGVKSMHLEGWVWLRCLWFGSSIRLHWQQLSSGFGWNCLENSWFVT